MQWYIVFNFHLELPYKTTKPNYESGKTFKSDKRDLKVFFSLQRQHEQVSEVESAIVICFIRERTAILFNHDT